MDILPLLQEAVLTEMGLYGEDEVQVVPIAELADDHQIGNDCVDTGEDLKAIAKGFEDLGCKCFVNLNNLDSLFIEIPPDLNWYTFCQGLIDVEGSESAWYLNNRVFEIIWDN